MTGLSGYKSELYASMIAGWREVGISLYAAHFGLLPNDAEWIAALYGDWLPFSIDGDDWDKWESPRPLARPYHVVMPTSNRDMDPRNLLPVTFQKLVAYPPNAGAWLVVTDFDDWEYVRRIE